MKYYLGIDIGGTNVKGVLVDERGKILCDGSVPTGCESGGENMCKNIASLCADLQNRAGVKPIAAGVGCPGIIAEDGTVLFAGNLGLNNFPLKERLSRLLSMPVCVTNDANAAALGEAAFGAGKDYNDSVFITLGTGVGGGIIIGGKIFEGGKNAGAEIGHMVIKHGGEKCTCGRKGCFEAYSSATALIRDTRKAMEADNSSAMWKCGGLDKVTGKTAFDYADCDPAAKSVVDGYVYDLACGIINLANIFRPQAVILGGGVAEQGDKLIVPLQERLDAKIFGGQGYAPVKIVKASLGNLAGALVASELVINS
ncbi:MAG: ROK family protein [Clostridia bacterium]|nr:ROK family protein [Clostridia bacterium]